MKVRYRGLAKNGAQVMTPFVLANLWMARKPILTGAGLVRLSFIGSWWNETETGQQAG